MENFYINRDSDLENEIQIDISEKANNAGLMLPVFVTSSIWQQIIEPDEEAIKMGENENGRIKDLLSQLVSTIRQRRQTQKTNMLYFNASYTKDGKSETSEIYSYLGPVNSENNNPCITLFTSSDVKE